MAENTSPRGNAAPAKKAAVKKAAPTKAVPKKVVPKKAAPKKAAVKKAAEKAPVKKAAAAKKAPAKKVAAKKVAPTKAVAAKVPAAERTPVVPAVAPVAPAVPPTPVSPTSPSNTSRRVLIGVAVAVVLALLAGGAAFALRNPAPSKAAYIVKAEALCVPANQPVTALAKPTSYPELSTAAAAVAAAAGAEATQLGHLRRPSGQNGRDAEAAITALNSYGTQAAALQAAADKKDDAGVIAATKAFQNAFAEASTKAKAFGFTACAAGMQPGVDMTLAGSTAVIKSEFTAKADSLCRGAAKQLDNLPGTPDSIAGLLADLDGSLAITDKLVADLRAVPVAPGDEAVVAQMLAAADKINSKGHELRDAAAKGDIARIQAITKEALPLGTDSDHQFDAYGLQVCGSSFGL